MRTVTVTGTIELTNGLDGAALAGVIGPPGEASDRRAAGIAARSAVSGALGVCADELEIVHRHQRPPAVLRMFPGGRLRTLDVGLSLSHRLGRAVAIAHPRPQQIRVGIDLECTGAVPAGLERLYLAPSERALLEHHEAATLWALKEAGWKALGLDDTVPFHGLELVCDDGGSLRALRSPLGVAEADATLWRPWPGFIAALVWVR